MKSSDFQSSPNYIHTESVENYIELANGVFIELRMACWSYKAKQAKWNYLHLWGLVMVELE